MRMGRSSRGSHSRMMKWIAKTPISAANPRGIQMHKLSLRWLVPVLVALLAFSGCQKRLSKANVDEVTTGMSRKQVESILGPPTSIDSTNLLITKKVTYVYQQGEESVTVVFFNDEVSSKESNLKE